MDPLTDCGRIEIDPAHGSLSWAAATRSKIQGAACGDRFLVRKLGASILVAAIDGAGSGTRAAQAAEACGAALSAFETATNLDALFASAHRACQGTCGAALALALINPLARQIEWAAVGDIDGLLIHTAPSAPCRRSSILQRGGTIGFRMPGIIPQSHPMAAGDTLILVSDGIRQSFRAARLPRVPVANLADEIFRDHARDNDDALILAARLECPS